LVPAPAADLGSRLDQALRGIPSGGQAGVVVYDCSAGTLLYAHDPDTPLSLASTTKLLITAAAFSACGPGWQFATRLYAAGPPAADGAIPGLGVIGGGDPCFDANLNGDDPELPFKQWAQVLKAKGVTRVDGDLVVDNHLFAGPIRPATYPQDAENQQRWYSAPASAFAWNDNCIEVRVVPGAPGGPAEVQVRPQSPRIQVRNQTRSVSRAENDIVATRDLDANAVVVSGNYSEITPWFPLSIYSDPDLLAGDQLKATFAQAGIAISGAVRLGPVDPRPGLLLVDQRHDLVPALTLMNQHSQNFYAEQMLRLVGRQRGGDGSIAAGCKAVVETLRPLIGARADAITLVDGSGLSYDDRAPAAAMLALELALLKSPVADDFVSTLKTKGYDWDDGKGHVKTGTHAEACCLVGVIDLPQNRRIAFASLLNRGSARTFDWSGALRQVIFRIICEEA
jgi:D-alanyl-D-alanine carboxypeptidase/D-alanyl-D-alanine-endopeptidase (penicillin-binding protein 4)